MQRRTRGVLRDLGFRVGELRAGRRMTQEDAAEKLGMLAPNYARVEQGRANCTVDTLVRVANMLGVPMFELFTAPTSTRAKIGRPPRDPKTRGPKEVGQNNHKWMDTSKSARYELGVSMMTDPKVLAEYEDLIGQRARHQDKLAQIDLRLDELRSIILGQDVAPEKSPTPEVEQSPVRPAKKGPSHWERLAAMRRGPPKSLAPVVAVVKTKGRVKNAEVAETLGITIEVATLKLSRAVKQGYLRRVAQGTYEVEPLG
jgi:transcriptional regulator with XRE-family HTH domain